MDNSTVLVFIVSICVHTKLYMDQSDMSRYDTYRDMQHRFQLSITLKVKELAF